MAESVFELLLNWIDADPLNAPFRYEMLRRKLIVFFEGRNCGRNADELADRVFDIVTDKLQSGEKLVVPNPDAYLYGVARNVAREQWKMRPDESLSAHDSLNKGDDGLPGRKAQRKAIASWEQDQREQSAGENRQSRLDCLNHCLARLTPETRQLVLDYYRDDQRARIVNRRNMAAALGLTANSLAIRVHRIRTELEHCISGCMNNDRFVPLRHTISEVSRKSKL